MLRHAILDLTRQFHFNDFKKEEIEQSIARRFEQQVDRYGDRPAIKTSDQTLSYSELDRLANQIAHNVLIRRRVGKEPVVVIVENDAWSIAAILGMLKAGKIYVPLEFGVPQPTARAIVENSQAKVSVSTKRRRLAAEKLISGACEVLSVDDFDSSAFDARPLVSVDASEPAHIIYTTGSTGQPKGVLDIHRNLLHHVMRVTNSSRYCADDRMTLLRSVSSWGGLANAYYALLNGACLLPFDIQKKGIGQLARWLIEEKITVYHSSATVFRHFADTLSREEQFPDLRLIRLGSEQITKKDFTSYKQHFSSNCILVNALSCTEAGTFRQNFVDKNSEISGDFVAVGYFVEDVEVLLLDDSGDNVGLGEVGEIAVKSRFLAPGYWRNPNLTSKVFLPDRAGTDERIYCTGDIGRILPDGCLEHLGRKDFQVKIRGYRVQADEIETLLLDMPGIEQAAVMARQDETGDRRLVAYVVPKQEQGATVNELRSLLKRKIPDHMVPSKFVVMDSLPLTPNGKINRQALPAPTTARPESDESYVPPRTLAEVLLVKIWSEVLHLDKVGVNDSFFELGGDSLLGSKMLSVVNGTFGSTLSLDNLFESPTSAQLWDVLKSNEATPGQTEKIAQIVLKLDEMSPDEIRGALEQIRGKPNDR